MVHEDSSRWLGARISVKISEKRPHLDRCGPSLHFKGIDPSERENYILIDENCPVASITASA
jgi:hypothetical protein